MRDLSAMSSNRLIIRSLLVLCLAGSAAACAGDREPAASLALTATEQYPIKVTPHQDQIMLAAHAGGVSPAQSAALSDMVDRWHDQGEAVIHIQSPKRGGEEAYRSVAAIQDALYALGVTPDKVDIVDYDPGARPNAPIIVGFLRYEARGPECGRQWTNFSSSTNNEANSNFGCSVTANVAAQVDNAGDFLAPRHSTPGDAGRRATVLNKYRSGDVTSSSLDSQAKGTVSTSVGQ
jgi:pilus assembly protein CpaD